MRLLKTGPYSDPGVYTLELIERSGDRIPPYAILSHTWALDPDEEILFADVTAGLLEITIPTDSDGKGDIRLRYTGATSGKKENGVQKCENAIRQARLDGYKYLWIDTCCIDKSSSAELSESINSMFRWYEMAGICYAYLDDVTYYSFSKGGFQNARYWTRGWCLQELIAPRTLHLFGKMAFGPGPSSWQLLGSKDTLAKSIWAITGIRLDFLTRRQPITVASIAERMSWAAKRQTSREEDLAYCLMGLFDVNMSMLYGEGGRKAFLRLQEAIMRDSDDQSIFAWIDLSDRTRASHGKCGLLADRPEAFGHFDPGTIIYSYTDFEGSDSYTMTNQGLNIKLHLSPPDDDGIIIAALGCAIPGTKEGFIGIHLKKLPYGANQYVRANCNKLSKLVSRGKCTEIRVRQNRDKFWPEDGLFQHHYFALRYIITYPDDRNGSTWRIDRAVTKVWISDKVGYRLEGVKLPKKAFPSDRGMQVYPSDRGMYGTQDGRPLRLPMIQTRGDCSVAIFISQQDKHSWANPFRMSGFVVLLGQTSLYEAGADVRDNSGDVNPASLFNTFKPTPNDSLFRLRELDVLVEFREEILDGAKIIWVSLEITILTPEKVTARQRANASLQQC